MRRFLRRCALALFLLYLALFPGSTITVALDRVPAWGEWMGNALLLLQGAAVLCWLVGNHGRRGALIGLSVFLLAWGVEHVGVTTGLPFGRYRYTEVLQPQLLGAVPLAIAFAWLMVALGAWQLATTDHRPPTTDHRPPTTDRRGGEGERGRRGEGANFQSPISTISLSSILYPRRLGAAATLVLLLDMQIETVATAVNRYWVWLDSGPYYGVPTANFVAWWAVGAAMALLVTRGLGPGEGERGRRGEGEKRRGGEEERGRREERPRQSVVGGRWSISRFTHHVSRIQAVIPAALYVLSMVMFTVVNLARGYGAAGLVGVATLGLVVLIAGRGRPAAVAGRAARQMSD